MSVLSDLDSVKIHLGISTSDSAEDNILNYLITAAESVVYEYTGRGEELGSSMSFTEYYDGTGKTSLWLRRFPVTAVSLLRVDQDGYYGIPSGAFPASTAYTEGTDFAIPRVDESEENRGELIALQSVDFQKFGGIWTSGRGNIKVTYTSGYTTAPKDLELAVNMLVALIRKAAEKGGPITSETIGRYSYRLLTGGGGQSTTSSLEIASVRAILGRYAA